MVVLSDREVADCLCRCGEMASSLIGYAGIAGVHISRR